MSPIDEERLQPSLNDVTGLNCVLQDPEKTQPSLGELEGQGPRPRGHMLGGRPYVRSSNVDLLAGQAG